MSDRQEQIANFMAYLEKVAIGSEAGIIAAIDKGAEEMVQLAQAACPNSEMDKHPGDLRESIHVKDGSDPLRKLVVADATDAKGNFYGPHVEFGHRNGGGHVPAHPFFYPAWRLVKRDAKARIRLAVKEAIRGGV
jgi:hypothetical protein